MALFEYYCEDCKAVFEQITSSSDKDAGRCPKCNRNNTRKLISKFAVAGRGDVRESTMHGCHDCFTGAKPRGGGCCGGACSGH